jgi:hypothetical protein
MTFIEEKRKRRGFEGRLRLGRREEETDGRPILKKM